MTQPEKQKLLPCPFCGADAHIFGHMLFEPIGIRYGIGCNGCGEIFFDCRKQTEELATKAWNTRTITDERRDWRAITEWVDDGKAILGYWKRRKVQGVVRFYDEEWRDEDRTQFHCPDYFIPLPQPPTAASDLEGE